MKYSFDWTDIEHASRIWFDQLDTLAKSEEGNGTRVLDEGDMKYIEEVMNSNLKLKRLMPYIIQETLFHYEEF
jgi:hypothetical protein